MGNNYGDSTGVSVTIIPVGEDKKTIYPQFSRAPYFAILRNGVVTEIIPNPFRNYPQRAGFMIGEYLIKYSPNEIIVKSIGRNAEYYFRNRNIRITRV